MSAHDHLVAIGQERPRLSVGKLDRVATPPRPLDQRAPALRLRTRDRSAAEKISRPEIAAVARVVSNELSDRPVHRGESAATDPYRILPPLAHGRGGEVDLDDDIQPAPTLIGVPQQIWKRRRIPIGPHVGGCPEGLECLERDDPWRYRRRKALGQERAERLVFPTLDVARRPVVEETEPEDVSVGVENRNGRAEGVAAADQNSELRLIIEAPGWLH